MGIADDNAVVRMGIRSLLATADDIVVVGEAGDGAAAVTLARTAKPDVMLLDVRMPRQDGVSAAPEVAQHATVLMLTYSDSPEVVSAAVKAGARGYLVHGHFTENELLSAVRMAARGMGTFSAQAVAALSNPTPSKAALASRYGLSEREADVMELMAQGAANGEIARSAVHLGEDGQEPHQPDLHQAAGQQPRARGLPVAGRTRSHHDWARYLGPGLGLWAHGGEPPPP